MRLTSMVRAAPNPTLISSQNRDPVAERTRLWTEYGLERFGKPSLPALLAVRRRGRNHQVYGSSTQRTSTQARTDPETMSKATEETTHPQGMTMRPLECCPASTETP